MKTNQEMCIDSACFHSLETVGSWIQFLCKKLREGISAPATQAALNENTVLNKHK